MKVVPQELNKQSFDVLIMNAGPNEISNINTSQHNFESMSEWKHKVAESSRKLFKLAEECLNNSNNCKTNPKI